MLTLAQSAELCQNKLLAGVYKAIIDRSPLMKMLEYDDIQGNALQYNYEDPDAPPSVDFYTAGEVIVSSEGGTKPVTTSLTSLIGDVDVPNIILKTRSDPTNQIATRVKMKTRAMVRKFEDTCIYGDDTAGREFDGLHAWIAAIATGQVKHQGSSATGAALSLHTLDTALDMVDDCNLILCNTYIRNRLTGYLRASGSYNTVRDEFGNQIEVWRNGIPIVATRALVQTETISGSAYSAKTGGATSSIFLIHLGADGLYGIQNGGITEKTFEELENKDASRVRLKWYVGLALATPISICRIDGITDVAVTA